MVLKKVLKKKRTQAIPATGSGDAESGEASVSPIADEGAAIPVTPAAKPYNVVSRDTSSSVSLAERQRLTAEAVALIKHQMTSPPENGKKGPYVPRSWAKNYKPALGPYKQFVQEQKGVFVVVDETSDNFAIKLAGDPTAVSNDTPWKRDLLKAWVQYSQKVPQGRRGADHFMSVLQGHKSAASIFSVDFVKVPKGEYVQSLPIPAAPAPPPPASPAAPPSGDAAAASPSPTGSGAVAPPSPTASGAAPEVAVVAESKRKKKMRLKAKTGVKAAASGAGSKTGGAAAGVESRRQRVARLKATGGAAGAQTKHKIKKRKG